MGRYSRNLHLGRRCSLWRIRKEIAANNLKIKEKQDLEAISTSTANKKDTEKIEEKVTYCPSNLPENVFYMEGILEIKPSVLAEYFNELYKNSC